MAASAVAVETVEDGPVAEGPAREPVSAEGELTIAWDQLGPAEWQERLAAMPHSNLLQSFAYGRAIRLMRQLMPRFGVISIAGQEVGLVQVQEARILGLHSFVLDRGPLWSTGAATPDVWRRFLTAINTMAPARLGRFRRIMPELPDTPANRALMAEAGYRLSSARAEGHQSVWIDLTVPEPERRAALAKGWRHALAQAERSRLDVEIDEAGRTLPWLLERYTADKNERGYGGPDPRLVTAIVEGLVPGREAVIYRARERGEPLAGILVLGHGTSATYQIGWTSGAGRMLNAHHLLLWRAMGHLAARGFTAFDLGGINPGAAEGVTRFKMAMGGDVYRLVPPHR